MGADLAFAADRWGLQHVASSDRPAVALTLDADLPRVVRRYVDRALPGYAELPFAMRVAQEGRMRMKPGGRWLSFTATEEYSVEEVAFAWQSRFPLAPMVWLDVVDQYSNGMGSLEGRLWGRARLLRAVRPDLARGHAQRYLSELFWMPYSIVGNPRLRWREVDERVVEVSTLIGSSPVSVQLEFDAEGAIRAVSSAARPRMVGKTTIDTAWRGTVGDYGSVGGIWMPRHAAVSWVLPGGSFTYWDGRVTDVEVVWDL